MTGIGRILAALLRQRRRLALATVAIALSIGYLAGALTLLDRVGAGLDRLAASTGERADLVIQGGIAYESPLEQVRRLVPTSVSETAAALPGVASVSPRVEDVAVLVGADGRPLVPLGLTEQPLGANWPDDDAVAPWELLDGRPPRADGEVVVDQRSAERAGLSVGDTIGVAGKAAVGPHVVVGIVRTEDGSLPPGTSLALFTTAEARRLFERPRDDNTVAIRLEPGADVDEVGAQLRALLPGGIEVVDGDTAARNRQEALSRSFTLVRVLVMGFAALALVVGMATVANSLSLLHAQRRHTFAELRLVGAHRRQLLAAALVEAVLLAAVGSLVGAPFGVLLGRAIESALGALDTAVPVAGSWLSATALGTAVLVGIVATVVAAVFPALRACRVPPVVAVAEAPARPTSRRRAGWRRRVAAAAGLGLAAGLLTAVLGRRTAAPGLPADGPAPVTVVAVAFGVALAALALSFVPALLSFLVTRGIRALPVKPLPLRRIAARDVARHRSRTAATTGALILAAGVVAGLAVFLESFSASVEGEVDQLVVADLVVDSGTFTRGGLPADLLQRLAGVEGVQAVSGWQVGRGTIAGRPVRLTGLDLAALPEVVQPEWATLPSATGADTVLLDEELADANGWTVGAVVPVTFTSGGTESLLLAGTYSSGSLLLGEAVVDRSVVSRQVPATADIAALVSVADGSGAGRAVRDLASDYGVSGVLAPEEFVGARAQLLRGFERVIQWMLLFTLVQALVGVVNTLLLSVGERRRELGLLRAAGASRRQVVRLVLLEGTSFALVGTVVGLVVGVVGAGIAVRSLASLGVDAFVAPLGTLVVTGVAAVVLGVLAAVVPARWAAGVPPLDAVADHGGVLARPRPAQRTRLRRLGRPAFHFEDLTVPATAQGAAGPVPAPVVPGRAPVGPPMRPLPAPSGAGPSPAPGSTSPQPAPVAAADVPGAASLLEPVLPGGFEPDRLGPAAPLVLGALAPGEELRRAVSGHARGHACVVAVTDRRVLVVADRPHRPLVQSLHPTRTGLSLHRAVEEGPLSLVVLDGDRMLELSGVTDVETATLMCVAPR